MTTKLQAEHVQRKRNKWAKSQRATKSMAEIDALWAKAVTGKLKRKW